MEKIKGMFIEKAIVNGEEREGLFEREVELGNILFYCLSNDRTKIKLIVKAKPIKGEIKIEDTIRGYVDYSKEAMDAIIKGMPMIFGSFGTREGNTRVRYENSDNAIFQRNMDSSINRMIEDQKNLRDETPEYPLGPFENTTPDERKDITKKNRNGRLAGWILAAITSVGLVAYIKYSESTPPEPVSVVIESDVTYSFNPNNPDELREQGKRFYEEVINKKNEYLLLTSDAFVAFDEVLAMEMVSYWNGIYPETMSAASSVYASAARNEFKRIVQAMNLFNASNQSAGDQAINPGKYIANSKHSALVSDTFTMALKALGITIEGEEPLNGKIAAKDEENVFSKEYLGAIDILLRYEKTTFHSATYNQAPVFVRFAVLKILNLINGTVVLPWSYIGVESEEEIRDADNRFVYYLDDYTNETWICTGIKNGASLFRKLDPEKCKPFGSTVTEEKLEAMAEENPNLKRKGFDAEIVQEINNILNEISADITYNALPDPTPQVKKY